MLLFRIPLVCLCLNALLLQPIWCRIDTDPHKLELLEQDYDELEPSISTMPAENENKFFNNEPISTSELSTSSDTLQDQSDRGNWRSKPIKFLDILEEIQLQRARLEYILEQKHKLQKSIASLEQPESFVGVSSSTDASQNDKSQSEFGFDQNARQWSENDENSLDLFQPDETNNVETSTTELPEQDLLPNQNDGFARGRNLQLQSSDESTTDGSQSSAILGEKDGVDGESHFKGHEKDHKFMTRAGVTSSEFGADPTPFGFVVGLCANKPGSSEPLDFKMHSYTTAAPGYYHFTISTKVASSISKLAVQIISFAGHFLGRFIQHTQAFTGPYKCTDQVEQVDDFTDATFYSMEVSSGMQDPPNVAAFEFTKPIKEYHFSWMFNPGERGEADEGFQIVAFVVLSEWPSCSFVQSGPSYSVSRYIGLPKSPVGSFSCHTFDISGISEAILPLDPDYEKLVIILKKVLRRHPDYCPTKLLFNSLPECTIDLTREYMDDFVEFKVKVSDSPGWLHVVVAVRGLPEYSKLGYTRIALQATSRSGYIIGKWLILENLCTNEIPSKLSYFEIPMHGTVTRKPTIIELDFSNLMKEYQLVWVYHPSESKEVSTGFQFHAFYEHVSGNCFQVAHSPVFTAPIISRESRVELSRPCQVTTTPGENGLNVLTLETGKLFYLDKEYKEECRSEGLREGTPPILPGHDNTTIEPTTTSERSIPLIPLAAEHGKEDEDDETINGTKIIGAEVVAAGHNKQKFYEECGEVKGCFGDPPDCIEKMTCTLLVSYQKHVDRCQMEIVGATGKYVAMGISRDRFMDEDTVVECVRELSFTQSTVVQIYSGFNTERKNHIRLRNHSALSFLSGSYTDGILYCKFDIFRITTFANLEFDLQMEKFYILAARGDSARNGPLGEVDYHAFSVASPVPYDLMEQFGRSDLRIALLKLHGTLAIIVWILLTPVSTFIVRYFKETFVDTFICSYSVWFATHGILALAAFVLMQIGLIVVGVEMNSFFGMSDSGWYFHNTAGVTLSVVMSFQICFGILISFIEKRCVYLHHMHNFVGHVQYLLGVLIIYNSKGMKDGLPCSSGTIIIGYVIVYFLIHLAMSYQVCYIDFLQGELTSRIYRSPGLIPARISELEREAPGGSVRKIFLLVFVVVSVSATITLLAMYLLGLQDCVALHRQAQVLDLNDYDI